MADTISPILPSSVASRATLQAPFSPVPQTPIERIVGDFAVGAEMQLQKLMSIQASLAATASDNANDGVPGQLKFSNAPITYDGFGNATRRSPMQTIYDFRI